MTLTVEDVQNLMSAAATPAAAMAAAEHLPDIPSAAQIMIGGAIALTIEQRGAVPPLSAVRAKLNMPWLDLVTELARGKTDVVKMAARRLAVMDVAERCTGLVLARRILSSAI